MDVFELLRTIGYVLASVFAVSCSHVAARERAVEVVAHDGTPVKETLRPIQAFGQLSILKSQQKPLRFVLIDAAAPKPVAFGRWSYLIDTKEGDRSNLVDIIARIRKGSVVNVAAESTAPGNTSDQARNYPEVRSTRMPVDTRAEADSCLSKLESGWLPPRILGKPDGYYLDCPSSADLSRGFLIRAARRESGVVIDQVQGYEYDILK